MKKRIKWTINHEKEGLVINPATGEAIVLYGEVFSVLREDIRHSNSKFCSFSSNDNYC
jgi:hypothetical protein